MNRTWRQARNQGFTEIANACFFYLTALVGFLVAVSFLSNAYRFYFPVLIGLAISIRFVGVRHMATHSAAPSRSKAAPIPVYPLAVG